MKKSMKLILFFILSLTLAGCAEDSNNSKPQSQTINDAKMQNIHEDMTTEEVEAELGAPELVEEDLGKIGVIIQDQLNAVKDVLENETLDAELEAMLEADYELLEDILRKILELEYEMVIYSYDFEEGNDKGDINFLFIDDVLTYIGVNVKQVSENV